MILVARTIAGDPIALSHSSDTSSVRSAYLDLARGVHMGVSSIRARAATPAGATPKITYDAALHLITLHNMPASSQSTNTSTSTPSAAASTQAATATTPVPVEGTSTTLTSYQLSPSSLRRACQCALCVDEHTGRQILKPRDIRDDVKPIGIQSKGNYAVAIHWSDGHASSIYPFDSILRVALNQTK
jgi:hypothetical protein